MVEHLTFNQVAVGSSPTALTSKIKDLTKKSSWGASKGNAQGNTSARGYSGLSRRLPRCPPSAILKAFAFGFVLIYFL
jgi:hypothetical protein